MDDFDDARFAQGPAPLAGPPRRRALPGHHAGRSLSGDDEAVQSGADGQRAGLELRCTEDLTEELIDGGHGELSVAVRGHTPAGRLQARAEMQLLAALDEVVGLTAVPTILAVEDDGYVRESAPVPRRRGGRRAAETGSPATAERDAAAGVRDALDALIDELHERGWVLGAATGEGLARRADGSVMVRDLHGLRPGEDLADRRADRAWADSVLRDPERTLRRRIHSRAGVLPGTVTPGSGPGRPRAPVAAGPASPVTGPSAGGGASGPGGGMVLDPPEQHDGAPWAEMRPPREGPGDRSVPVGASPSTASARLRPLRRLRAAANRGGAGRRRPREGGLVRSVRGVLVDRDLRRRAVLSGVAALVAGLLLGTGSWLALAPDGTEAVAGQTTSPEQTPTVDPAPAIEDPWALAAEIAGSRHAYITGLSSRPVSVPGSAAAQEDAEVRRAYDGLIVDGGGPVVHEAALLEGPSEAGVAELLVITSTEAYSVRDSAGEAEGTVASGAKSVPASAGVEIRLSLQWDGTRWLVAGSAPTAGDG